jgi:hypothetical protein
MPGMSDERIEVQRTIEAEPAAIFAVLRDPQGHVAIDASGMLQDATGEPAGAVGDEFVVHMDRESLNDYPLGKYDVTIEITAFEPDREIAWTIHGQIQPSIGHVYGYRVAAVDTSEHVSALSAEIIVAPRPDASGELVYSFQSNAALSGFRFQTTETTDPILAGTATTAQWRLEQDATGWRIVPLNGTAVLEYPGGRTTALVCGPGSDANCRAATRAPVAGYQTTPIAVNPEYSYVFRVTGSDGQPHYGVVRVQLLGSDGAGHDLMIFDWAYQTLPNDARLDRLGH